MSFLSTLPRLLVIFLCLGLFASPVLADDEKAEAAVIGKKAPALVTQTLDGKDFDLSSLQGKVVVIHFWATWCAPCREEMPALEAVWRHFHKKGLEVLALSADRPRARGDVDQVMHVLTFPAAMLTNVRKNDFGTPTSIPITYVIDKSGNLANILTPDTTPLTEEAFGNLVKNLLDAQETPKPEVKSAVAPDAKIDGKNGAGSEAAPEKQPAN